jgi:hypothetical protein
MMRLVLHTSRTQLAQVSHPGYKLLDYSVFYGYVKKCDGQYFRDTTEDFLRENV